MAVNRGPEDADEPEAKRTRPEYQEKGKCKGKSKGKGKGKCHLCSDEGHYMAQCPQRWYVPKTVFGSWWNALPFHNGKSKGKGQEKGKGKATWKGGKGKGQSYPQPAAPNPMEWMDFPPLNQVGSQQEWNDGYSGGWSDGQSGGYMMALTRGKSIGATTTAQTTVQTPAPTTAPTPVSYNGQQPGALATPSRPIGSASPKGCETGSVHSRRFMANDPSGEAAAPAPKTPSQAEGSLPPR